MSAAGLQLHKFTVDNADLVLSWRNAEHVRVNSLNTTRISRQEHLNFVADLGLCNDKHFYILHENGVPQAVLNVCQSSDGSALWGCYIGGEGPVRPGLFPMLIAVAGSIAFDRLGCTELNSEVLHDNVTPQKTNTFLSVAQSGRRIHTDDDGRQIDVLLYCVMAQDWPDVRSRINSILTRRQREMLLQFAANPGAAII